MKYVVARGKAEAKAEFASDRSVFDDLSDAMDSMNYQNKYGYYSEFEHFIYEVEVKVKAKKLI